MFMLFFICSLPCANYLPWHIWSETTVMQQNVVLKVCSEKKQWWVDREIRCPAPNLCAHTAAACLCLAATCAKVQTENSAVSHSMSSPNDVLLNV